MMIMTRFVGILPLIATLAVGACALDPNETLVEALEAPAIAAPQAQPASATSPLIHGGTPAPLIAGGANAPLAASGKGPNLLSFDEQSAAKSNLEALARSRSGTTAAPATSSVELLKRLGATHGDAAIADIEGVESAPPAAQ